MPANRPIASLTISFGLVAIPVKLYSAVQRKNVRFHQLNGKTGVRIQQKRVDPSTGDEVRNIGRVSGPWRENSRDETRRGRDQRWQGAPCCRPKWTARAPKSLFLSDEYGAEHDSKAEKMTLDEMH